MRILVVEDDKNLNDATVAQLQHEGFEVDAAYNGDEGLYYITEGSYDLVLLDRMLPGMDGVSVLKAARGRGISTPVLLLTALGQIGDKVDGLDAGADDYLVKPFDVRELLARVRALVRRPSQMVAAELTYQDLLLDTTALMLQGELGRCTLSKKETELLAYLIKNAEQTLGRAALFSHVWGPDADVEEASLDSYAHFVRRRLAAVSQRVCLATVRGVGYRLEEVIL